MAIGWWRIGAIQFIRRPPARAKLHSQPSHTLTTIPPGRRMHPKLFGRKIFWPGVPSFCTMPWNVSAGESPLCMKAKIIITPKKAVLDPQGKTVQNALAHMGYSGVKAVHVGKYLEIELDGEDKQTARQRLDEACHKFLSNPLIEDYRLEIE
jgi:phosphoribosylformylglycinamidine synthase